MNIQSDGSVTLPGDVPAHRLRLEGRIENAWRLLPLVETTGALEARAHGIHARLQIAQTAERFDYLLSFSAAAPTRLRLVLELPEARNAFHLIPGVVFGANNLADAGPGHHPNLTAEKIDSPSCAAYWEFRADRASHPVSAVAFDGGIAAVSIDPYSEGQPRGDDSAGRFIRNGVLAQVRHDDAADACGVTLGYGNLPRTFTNKNLWEPATQHMSVESRATGSIFLTQSEGRRDLHQIMRSLHARYRQVPAASIEPEAAIADLVSAFLNISWHGEDGANLAGTSRSAPGGKQLREHFTNLRCRDEARSILTAWRTLVEIGWTGGAVIGYPLLAAGYRLGDQTALQRAAYVLDQVADGFNPDSGLLWDVCGKHEGKRVNGWWIGYLVKDVHSSYTNGSAAYYLLKAHACAKRHGGRANSAWADVACRTLETIEKLQRPDGNFGYTYRTDRPEIVDDAGFAGVWFVAAMMLAYQHNGHAPFLEAAKRGAAFYYDAVKNCCCSGSPMDTYKAPEQEGNLAFLHGVRLLHEVTGEQRFLDMACDSAEYEYLWRYAFRARPQYPPLKDSSWNSCGGSITSVSNPHIHQMGLVVVDDLLYVAKQTNDDYHRQRVEDSVRWALNCIELYPHVMGYGQRGVMTERFCPSDGLTIETFPDGSPSSIWFAYNGWSAAAILEGLLDFS